MTGASSWFILVITTRETTLRLPQKSKFILVMVSDFRIAITKHQESAILVPDNCTPLGSLSAAYSKLGIIRNLSSRWEELLKSWGKATTIGIWLWQKLPTMDKEGGNTFVWIVWTEAAANSTTNSWNTSSLSANTVRASLYFFLLVWQISPTAPLPKNTALSAMRSLLRCLIIPSKECRKILEVAILMDLRKLLDPSWRDEKDSRYKGALVENLGKSRIIVWTTLEYNVVNSIVSTWM